MTTIALDPVSKAHVMYDILNEPDCRSIGWEGGGSGGSMVRPAADCCLSPRRACNGAAVLDCLLARCTLRQRGQAAEPLRTSLTINCMRCMMMLPRLSLTLV
jgi:hypothetical protein